MPRFIRRRFKFDDFHPMLKSKRKVELSALNKFMKEAKEWLPQKLSEVETDEKWDKFMKEGDQRARS